MIKYEYLGCSVVIEPHMMNLFAEVHKNGKLLIDGACGLDKDKAKEIVNKAIDKKLEDTSS